MSIFGKSVRPVPMFTPSVPKEEPPAENKPVVEDKPIEEVKTVEPVVEEKVEDTTVETNAVVANKEEAIEDDKTAEEDLSIANKTEAVEEKTNEQIKEEESTTEEEKPKRKRATRKADTAEIVSVSDKLTGASKLPDAVALVVPEYEDPEYAEWVEHMHEILLHTVFDERADAGVIKVILSNIARAYDNATRRYAETSAKLETVANKNYGLIVRQIAANSNGANDAERKRSGLRSPEVYKGTGGKTVNLYALEAGLRKQTMEIQAMIKQLELKKSVIIAYLTAEKMDAQ
jgi:hypothetical protein